MALNRDEKIQLLAALLKKDHPKFAELARTSTNISQLVKIELLSAHVELIYGDDPDAIKRLLKVLAANSDADD